MSSSSVSYGLDLPPNFETSGLRAGKSCSRRMKRTYSVKDAEELATDGWGGSSRPSIALGTQYTGSVTSNGTDAE